MFGTIFATAIIATAPLGHHRPIVKHHLRGCNTTSCDRRIRHFVERWRRIHRPRFQTSEASWYDDSGSTASGAHYTLGFAHLGPGEGSYAGMAFGTRVEFCAARCAIGRMDDHGPYVAGREFDLNANLKAAIGASDLGPVRWRIVR